MWVPPSSNCAGGGAEVVHERGYSGTREMSFPREEAFLKYYRFKKCHRWKRTLPRPFPVRRHTNKVHPSGQKVLQWPPSHFLKKNWKKEGG